MDPAAGDGDAQAFDQLGLVGWGGGGEGLHEGGAVALDGDFSAGGAEMGGALADGVEALA